MSCQVRLICLLDSHSMSGPQDHFCFFGRLCNRSSSASLAGLQHGLLQGLHFIWHPT